MENVINSLEDIASDVYRFIFKFAFGDIYTREELSLEEKELINNLASLLTTGGFEAQLEFTLMERLMLKHRLKKLLKYLSSVSHIPIFQKY